AQGGDVRPVGIGDRCLGEGDHGRVRRTGRGCRQGCRLLLTLLASGEREHECEAGTKFHGVLLCLFGPFLAILAAMAYVVADPCVKCKYTDCVAVCPVDCFYEGKNSLAINPDECIDCGACEPECPTTAI